MTIRVGQIREEKKCKTKFVITYLNGEKVHCIDFDGVCYCSIFSKECIENTSDVIAEYPTWQEAVNSKEFKG